MSSRRDRHRSQSHYSTFDGYNWSAWEWVPERNQEERYRVNSRGQYIYDYRHSQPTSDAPRSIEGFNTSTSQSEGTEQEYDEYEEGTQYRLSSQTTGAAGSTLVNANSTASQLIASSQNSYHDSSPSVTSSLTSQLDNLQVSQPIAIAQSPVRTVYNTRAPEFVPSMQQPLIADYRRGYVSDMNAEYIQDSFSTYNRQPVQPQYQANTNEEDLMGSSMETVVPRCWGTTGGLPSTENSNITFPSFAQSNVASPLPVPESNPTAPTSETSFTYARSTGIETRNDSRSRSNTPQPQRPTHKKITTLTESTLKEKLAPEYKVHYSSSFQPCRIFKILWSEPKGETSRQSNASDSGTVVTGERFKPIEGKYKDTEIYSTIRRFVIVAGDEGHCQCLPILTYGGQGTLKAGVKPKDHTIIYTGKPGIFQGEQLDLSPIKMVSDSSRDKLDPASRINYAKIYTIEHNVKVQFIGKIEKSFRRKFMTDFDLVWSRKRFNY